MSLVSTLISSRSLSIVQKTIEGINLESVVRLYEDECAINLTPAMNAVSYTMEVVGEIIKWNNEHYNFLFEISCKNCVGYNAKLMEEFAIVFLYLKLSKIGSSRVLCQLRQDIDDSRDKYLLSADQKCRELMKNKFDECVDKYTKQCIKNKSLDDEINTMCRDKDKIKEWFNANKNVESK